VVFAASECLPFVKTGGLADVTASLPKALAALGHEVDIVLPLYLKALLYPIDAGVPIRANHALSDVCVRLDDAEHRARVYSTEMPDAPVRVHLVDSDSYAHFTARAAHASPYAGGDNFGRFAFFSRVVARVAANMQPRPDVIHAHDWPTGLVPTFVSTEHAASGIATVFTIHNVGHTHAVAPDEFWRATRLTDADHPGLYDWKNAGILHADRVDLLKAGIVRADMVSTVSPTYAAEIQQPERGGSYAPTLRWLATQGRLRGILNGIDPMWSPTLPIDAFLEHKRAQKQQLQAAFGLPSAPEAFVCVLTSRLAHQKGYQLLPEALALLRRGRARVQLVAAVDGDPGLRELFASLDHPDLPVRHRPYHEALTRDVIYPGADALLMPSVYEPCGLSQMIAQKNGAPPIVHATGGLRDTVVEGETGFVFERFGPDELARAIGRALHTFTREPARWAQLQRRMMDLDYGWARSADAYVELYREAIARAAARGAATTSAPAPSPPPARTPSRAPNRAPRAALPLMSPPEGAGGPAHAEDGAGSPPESRARRAATGGLSPTHPRRARARWVTGDLA
jgi:starch synthase